MPSTLLNQPNATTQPLHAAIIMDGNGRWATCRGLPRSAGHIAGAKRLRSLITAAPELGITKLTLFAFSADNWRRPAPEVTAIMGLLENYLTTERNQLIANGIRLSFIGRRDRIAPALFDKICQAERATLEGKTLHLRIALDYSSRDSIIAAASMLPPGVSHTREVFMNAMARANPAEPASDAPTHADVDLLIRTGGEKRLSDFLLWESAYAELCFSDLMFPDFTALDLRAAILDFTRRDRRFGGLSRVA
jgi:undecaprenyl diphosphate synthase